MNSGHCDFKIIHQNLLILSLEQQLLIKLDINKETSLMCSNDIAHLTSQSMLLCGLMSNRPNAMSNKYIDLDMSVIATV